jgi:endo-1,4-beta-xylanase
VRIALLQACTLTVVLGVGGCAPEEPANPDNTGGSPGASGGTGPTQQGGTGPAASGGRTGSGGITGSGGMAPGTGGASPNTGGKATGGSATGGTATGGKATGGSATGGGTAVNCSGTPLTGGTQHCSSSAQGTVGSFSWSIWSSGSGGCITPYGVGAAFKANWNNSGDFLARVGFQWNETQTYDQLGTISADYAYTKTGNSGGVYSYIGIYGWSNGPLIEFYIVDDWFGSGPPSITWGDGVLKGTFTVDGGTYKVFTHTQVSQPSIHGTQTFPQFYSVRQTARQCGHISITEHFKQWASLGMTLGKMYEAKLLVEAGGGVGSIDYTLGTMTRN